MITVRRSIKHIFVRQLIKQEFTIFIFQNVDCNEKGIEDFKIISGLFYKLKSQRNSNSSMSRVILKVQKTQPTFWKCQDLELGL